jgi:uncharacterized membrane protein
MRSEAAQEIDRAALKLHWHHDARQRLAAAVVFGLLVAAAIWIFWDAMYAPLIGWSAMALMYDALTWYGIWPMNPQQTAANARREIPQNRSIHILLLLAAFASLGGIGLLVFHSQNDLASAAVTLLTVIASWVTVQTIYTLRYARHYYEHDQKVLNFNNDDPPQYSDFAYVATTVGMSYAISDTNAATSDFRKMSLGHALLAYLFGTVFVAALVNILAGLSPG